MKTSRFFRTAIQPFGQLKSCFLSPLLFLIISFPSQIVLGQNGNTNIENKVEATTQPSGKALILGTREVRLLTETNPQDFEKWIEAYWNSQWQDFIPEFQSFISNNYSEEDGNIYTYYLILNSKRVDKSPLRKLTKKTNGLGN